MRGLRVPEYYLSGRLFEMSFPQHEFIIVNHDRTNHQHASTFIYIDTKKRKEPLLGDYKRLAMGSMLLNAYDPSN